jgi:hypothetical protein
VTPLGDFTEGFAREEARAVFGSAREGARAAGLTLPVELVFTPDEGEVNARSGCPSPTSGRVELSRGVVLLAAQLAATRALDDDTGSDVHARYVDALARLLRRGGAVVPAAPRGLAAGAATGGAKLARQRVLFDDVLTFVLAHELGHLALGHAPCGGGDAAVVRGRRERERAADAWALHPARPWRPAAARGARLLLAFYARWEHLADDGGVVLRGSHPTARERLDGIGDEIDDAGGPAL